MLERREFIQTASAFAVGAVLPSALSGCGIRPEIAATSLATSDAIDEALMLISKLAPLGNHAPMAVESLVTLGRPELLIPFVEKYSRRFGARHPSSVAKIDPSNWKEALGSNERNLDWTTFFQRELKETGWKVTVGKWSEVLAPGLSAAAGHGVIRTCHAVRSLSRRETAPRLDELAEGLGYWAAFYQPLPEPGGRRNADHLSIADAVERIPILPEERRRRGSIMEQLRSLNDFSDFADVIDQIEITGGSDALLSKLTETFARIYVQRATDRNDLNLLHAVTVTSGIRSLTPFLSPGTTTRVLRYGWQTAAAMVAISGSELPPRKAATMDAKDDLVERAVSSNEEHSIKFTEACLREHQLNTNAIYLQAANEAVRRLPRH